jgi:ribosomal protein S18 acetylase RimI-like enzyme
VSKAPKTNFTVRPATAMDAAGVLRFLLELDCVVDTMLFEPNERITTEAQQAEILLRFESAATSHFYIAISDNEIIGFCVIDGHTLRRIRHRGMLIVGVLPPFQHKGVGKELLAQSLSAAKQSGLQKIELTVMPENDTAIRLYKKLGFKEEGLCKMAIERQGIFSDLIYMGLIFKR